MDFEEIKSQCKEKGGRWDEKTEMCILPEERIDNRKDAIDNFVYRVCEEKIKDRTYLSRLDCMKKEGFARRKAMYKNPYQDQFLEPKYIRKIMRETVLGDLRGYNKQYRYAGYIHARTKENLGIVQADKYPPMDVRHIPEYISYKLKNKQEEEILVF